MWSTHNLYFIPVLAAQVLKWDRNLTIKMVFWLLFVKKILGKKKKKKGFTWTSLRFHGGWLINPASSIWLATAACSSVYVLLSNCNPGNRSLIRLRNKGSSSSIWKEKKKKGYYVFKEWLSKLLKPKSKINLSCNNKQ